MTTEEELRFLRKFVELLIRDEIRHLFQCVPVGKFSGTCAVYCGRACDCGRDERIEQQRRRAKEK